MTTGLRKPKAVPKKIATPKSQNIKAATTKALEAELAARRKAQSTDNSN